MGFSRRFSEEGERIEETAARELEEETGIAMTPEELTLIGVYSKPGRDPRGWTVSAAYLAVVDPEKVKPIAQDDAADAGWFTVMNNTGKIRFSNGKTELTIDDLAFDHDEIMMDALKKVYRGNCF